MLLTLYSWIETSQRYARERAAGEFVVNLYKTVTSTVRRAAQRISKAKFSPSTVHAAPLPSAPHLRLGVQGERLAAAYLEEVGYHLVAANFRLPMGRNLRGRIIHGEIDIVAYEAATLCFIEVKTRASDWFLSPEANVDLRKQRQISRAARVYRRLFNLRNISYRYDVVSVVLPHAVEGDEAASPGPRLELLRGFWTDAKFHRKHRWFEPMDH